MNARPDVARTAEQRARELLIFADGVEDAGHPQLARRSRAVARDVLELVAELQTERAGREKIQADRDRLLEMAASGTLRGADVTGDYDIPLHET